MASDFLSNWTILDSFPGIFIGTAAVVNSEVSGWSSAQLGQLVYETDAGLSFRWNGSALVRSGPIGLLGTNVTTSNQTATSGTSPKILVSETVTVPASPRTVKISGFLPSVSNPTTATTISLVRDSTTLQTVVIPVSTWRAAGGAGDADYPLPLSLLVYDTPTAGSHAYTIKATVASGTATFVASATSSILISAEEV